MVKEKRQPFKYKRRSEDSFQKQAERSSGSWDRIFKDGFKEFRPKEGDHRIRILPPTFEGAEHYALSLWVHGQVGPDKQQYLCLQKMNQEPCPVCEEHRRAQKEGDQEYADQLRAYERRVAWVIDRSTQGEGPLLYNMPFSKMDKRICAVAKDQETGETLWLDDPDEGYDVFFRREGSGLKTDYNGHAPARRPSPISKDEDEQAAWLAYVQANPLDSVLQFYSYDHIQAAFSGAVAKKGDDEEDPEPDVRHAKDRKDFAARVDQRGGKGKEAEEEDLDEDEAPPRAAKAKPTAVDPDEDDDEDEAAPPTKARRAAAVDEDDEDDAPPLARKAKAAVEDDDDDADEDEAPPTRAAKPGKRATVVDEEEEEEDEPQPVRRRGR